MPAGNYSRFAASWAGVLAVTVAIGMASALAPAAARAADVDTARAFPATEMGGPALPPNIMLLKRAGPPGDGHVLRLGVAESGYPPLEIMTTGGQVAGITADYAALVGKRLKRRVEVVTAPDFAVVLDLLKRGEIDLVGSVSRTAERATYATFSAPYLSSQPVVIQRRDTEKRNDSQLGTVIAVDKGSAVIEFVKRDFPSGKLVELSSPLAALQMVARGQADSYVGEIITAAYLIETRYLSSLRIRSAAGFATGELGFAVSSAQPELAQLAEKSNLIDTVTKRMVEVGLKQLKDWKDQGFETGMAINLSLSYLGSPGIADQVTGEAQRLGLDPKAITLEVTESLVTSDLGHVLENLARLRMRGFDISIDDYGTGFSSMQQLSRIPFTELKIDQSFVTGATSRAQYACDS